MKVLKTAAKPLEQTETFACSVQPSVRLADVGDESATAKVASVANYPMDAWKALSLAMDPLWGDEQGAQLIVELLKVNGSYATIKLPFLDRCKPVCKAAQQAALQCRPHACSDLTAI